jgi:hypothetical protein
LQITTKQPTKYDHEMAPNFIYSTTQNVKYIYGSAAAPPTSPLAVLKRLMGLLPSVMSKLLTPSPLRSLACISGPAWAID